MCPYRFYKEEIKKLQSDWLRGSIFPQGSPHGGRVVWRTLDQRGLPALALAYYKTHRKTIRSAFLTNFLDEGGEGVQVQGHAGTVTATPQATSYCPRTPGLGRTAAAEGPPLPEAAAAGAQRSARRAAAVSSAL